MVEERRHHRRPNARHRDSTAGACHMPGPLRGPCVYRYWTGHRSAEKSTLGLKSSSLLTRSGAAPAGHRILVRRSRGNV